MALNADKFFLNPNNNCNVQIYISKNQFFFLLKLMTLSLNTETDYKIKNFSQQFYHLY